MSRLKKAASLLVALLILILLASCSEPDNITVIPGSSADPNHTHSFTDWEISSVATCVSEGVRERFCECGERHSAPIKKLPHSYGKWETAKTQDDDIIEEERTCSCGERQTRIAITSIPAAIASFICNALLEFIYGDYEAPAPIITSEWTISEDCYVKGDIYVSKRGSEAGTGTSDDPYLTIQQAMEAVRDMDKSKTNGITVCIEAGEYNVGSLIFDASDGGTAACPITYRAIGGEVIINGGIALLPSDFESVTSYPEIAERLPSDVKNDVLVIDLKKEPYSLIQSDWGELYPIGTYNTAGGYQGNTTGPMYSELFVNGKRQSLARYPDSGYIYTGEVVSSGKYSDVTDENGDPSPDIYRISSELAKRIAGWKDLSSVWAYGFWMYDWADGSSPIKNIDSESNSLSLKYQSFFGTKEGAPYYFYNCLEELSCEGEWYLERESGLLCLYAPKNMSDAQINLSLSTSGVIQINADYITLDGITVTGSRSGGITIYGNNNCVTNCVVKNVSGEGIQATGCENKIVGNEICGTGRGGISVLGGDTVTLTPANNLVSNNLIHDWSQIFKTYQAGINVGGVGNVCSHNELYNAPHLAITYGGNNNIFEYNLIYNVCLETDDAGAIYAGRSWTSYGNHIRYNCIYNIGGSSHTPDGIYMDDAISGQSIYGNLLINIPKYAIFIGGGRDMSVYGNVIVNPGECAIRYDSRARDAVLGDTWFSEHVRKGSGNLWTELYSSPWKSEIWLNAFPQYREMTDDFNAINDPRFIPNPANSTVCKNAIFDKTASIGKIDSAVNKFSTVESNKIYALFSISKYFEDAENGNYALLPDTDIFSDIQDFQRIPIEKIGRK